MPLPIAVPLILGGVSLLSNILRGNAEQKAATEAEEARVAEENRVRRENRRQAIASMLGSKVRFLPGRSVEAPKYKESPWGTIGQLASFGNSAINQYESRVKAPDYQELYRNQVPTKVSPMSYSNYDDSTMWG
jgi:hypothetical protein